MVTGVWRAAPDLAKPGMLGLCMRQPGTPASIVIPTRARPDYLRVALASIAPQAVAAGAEVLVVDDAGPSPAVRGLAERFGARYEPHPAPLGLNVARNTGVERSTRGAGGVRRRRRRGRPRLAAGAAGGRARAPGRTGLRRPHPRPPGGPCLRAAADVRRRPSPHSISARATPTRCASRGAPTWPCAAPPSSASGLFDVDAGARRRRAGVAGTLLIARQTRRADRILYVAAPRSITAAPERTHGCARWRAPPTRTRARRPAASTPSAGRRPVFHASWRTLAGCLGHVVRRRCPAGLTMAAHSLGRVREGAAERGRGTPSVGGKHPLHRRRLPLRRQRHRRRQGRRAQGAARTGSPTPARPPPAGAPASRALRAANHPRAACSSSASSAPSTAPGGGGARRACAARATRCNCTRAHRGSGAASRTSTRCSPRIPRLSTTGCSRSTTTSAAARLPGPAAVPRRALRPRSGPAGAPPALPRRVGGDAPPSRCGGARDALRGDRAGDALRSHDLLRAAAVPRAAHGLGPGPATGPPSRASAAGGWG